MVWSQPPEAVVAGLMPKYAGEDSILQYDAKGDLCLNGKLLPYCRQADALSDHLFVFGALRAVPGLGRPPAARRDGRQAGPAYNRTT